MKIELKWFRRGVFMVAGIMMVMSVIGCGGGNDKGDESDAAGTDDSVGSSLPAEDSGGAHGHAGETHSASGGHTHTTRIEVASQPAALPVGGKATWTIRVLDAASGAPVKEFDTVHEKILHLIVVKSDLSWFNHIHPVYKGEGLFTITTALPTEGSYKLYADYTPKGGGQEVAQHEFATGGSQPSPVSILPVVDAIGDGGWIVKKVSSAPEGEPGAQGGNSYVVAMMPMPGRLVAGEDAMLHFQVRDAAGKPLAALERYLGAGGHAVILSSDTRIYLHTHPMEGGGSTEGTMDHTGMNHEEANHADAGKAATAPGSDVTFHTTFPDPGIYKIWGQFQHGGRIITAAYVVKVDPATGK